MLFGKGISLQRENKYAWHYTSALSPQYAVSPDGVPSGFQVWPLVPLNRGATYPALAWCFLLLGGRLLDIYRSELARNVSYSLSYVMSAVLYHCKTLA